MSAPTLWEEGQTSGRRLIWLTALTCALLAILDVLVFGHLTAFFDVCFVLVSVAAALAVRPRDFFTVGVLPPFVLLGLVLLLGIVSPGAVAGTDDGVGQAVVAGLAHHSGALFAAAVNTLVVLAVRRRILFLRDDRAERRSSPYAIGRDQVDASGAARVPADAFDASYSKRDGSPEPSRVTSGDPEEKSTTVVGAAVGSSPESRTASSF